jgi:hypothetical protein
MREALKYVAPDDLTRRWVLYTLTTNLNPQHSLAGQWTERAREWVL